MPADSPPAPTSFLPGHRLFCAGILALYGVGLAAIGTVLAVALVFGLGKARAVDGSNFTPFFLRDVGDVAFGLVLLKIARRIHTPRTYSRA